MSTDHLHNSTLGPTIDYGRFIKSLVMDVYDWLYQYYLPKNSLFEKGWGRQDHLDQFTMPQPQADSEIVMPKLVWLPKELQRNFFVQEASFPTVSPLVGIPEVCKKARVLLVAPRGISVKEQSLYIHFSATGDDGFYRRRHYLAEPLAKEGISSLLLETPYYGARRPDYQKRSNITTVRDLLYLASISIDEGRSLVKWALNQGYKQVGFTGISRGGLVSTFVSSVVPYRIATVGFIPGHSGEPTFSEGILKRCCDWDALRYDGTSQPIVRSKWIGPPVAQERDVKKMRSILAATDIRHIPVPEHQDAAVFICAKNDGIVPASSAKTLADYWNRAELRWIRGGHVSAILFNRNEYRQVLRESLNKV